MAITSFDGSALTARGITVRSSLSAAPAVHRLLASGIDMKRTSWSLIALALLAPLVVASVPAAAAVHAGGKNHPASASPVRGSSKQPGVQPAALTRYQQVASTSLTDPANSQVEGSVGCPAHMKVLSGGAVISSTSLGENLNSSIPSSDGTSWQVWVNNSSQVDGSFVVYAVCERGIGRYSIVTGGESVDPPGLGESDQTQASCPKSTVVYGGGDFVSSSSPYAMMASSQPGYGTDVRTWYSAANNRSEDTTDTETYAVCGARQAGYVHVVGTPSSAAPNTQVGVNVSCPSGDVMLGGGGSPAIFWDGLTDLNSTAASNSTMWSYWENNYSAHTVDIQANAVCATFS